MTKMEQLQSEVKTVKAMLDSFNPSIDIIKNKLSPLKSELKQTGFSVASLDRQSQKLAKTIGSFIGLAATGDVRSSKNALGAVGSSLVDMLPKLLKSNFAGTRANGGAVNSGNSYLVGENGPEMFVPSQPGNISPKAGGNINLVMNINTPDATSFRKSQSQIMAEATLMLRRAERNL